MYSDTTVWAQKFNLCSLWFNRVIRPLPPLWVLQEIVGFAALGNWWLEVKTNLDFISDYTIGREKIAKWTKKKITQLAGGGKIQSWNLQVGVHMVFP